MVEIWSFTLGTFVSDNPWNTASYKLLLLQAASHTILASIDCESVFLDFPWSTGDTHWMNRRHTYYFSVIKRLVIIKIISFCTTSAVRNVPRNHLQQSALVVDSPDSQLSSPLDIDR